MVEFAEEKLQTRCTISWTFLPWIVGVFSDENQANIDMRTGNVVVKLQGGLQVTECLFPTKIEDRR